VRALLFDPFRPRGAPARTRVVGALRRRPTELAGWPELVRRLDPVELTAPQRQLYELAWEEFRRELELSKSGKNSTNPLVAALRFRQKASLLRVDGTVQAVRDAVQDGLRPAVSVQFRETATQIADQLGQTLRVGRIDGSVPATERETLRVAFQRGELDVVLFSVVEGISLHAGETAVGADNTPRVLLLHDLRWSALEMAQIEGRTHRDGQAALACYLFAADSVEERMVEAVVGKLATMASMLGDDLTALEALLAARA
jgi:SNF2 family DNA or RNA helicase